MREGMREPSGSPGNNLNRNALDPIAIVLGFDFGTRRVGVALGNGITRSAHALKVLKGGSAAAPALWRELTGLIDHWQPQQLVVGVPRHPDGAAHEMTARCERFARQLEGRFPLPVARVDERYSTAVLPADSATDDRAAAVILQQWFDETAAQATPRPALHAASPAGSEVTPTSAPTPTAARPSLPC
jgi:putative Holliday junction resolvase